MAEHAIFGLFGFIGMIVLFYGPWQTFCVDYFRQYAFERRDKLFDLAMRGKLDFASLEYLELRGKIEALIRFSHKLTFPRVIWLWIFCPPLRQSSELSMAAVAHENSSDHRQEIAAIISEIQRAIVLTMIIRSAFAVVILITMIPIFIMAVVALNIGKNLGLAIASTLESIVIRRYIVGVRSLAGKAELESITVRLI